ncbi:MAG TPA: hypothetical protein VG867_02550 [Rhizomicrobium sp.]|nr:hypothetical protein [Rhizomicrobium sp.]
MLKLTEADDPSANAFYAKMLDSEVVQALRVVRPRGVWWIVPAVVIVSGIAGWVATLPFG